jgi:hypothetical protein
MDCRYRFATSLLTGAVLFWSTVRKLMPARLRRVFENEAWK